MIRVNLLTADRQAGVKPKARAVAAPFQIGQKLTIACSLILLATALGIGWWYWSLQEESGRLDEAIAAGERETAQLRTVLQQVQEIEQRKAKLEQRVALIEELRKGQNGPVHLLDEVSRSLPDQLWLTELKEQKGELTIDGRAVSLTALSDFVGNLESSGYFKRPVEIVNSQVEAQPGGELIRFTVKAQFGTPGV